MPSKSNNLKKNEDRPKTSAMRHPALYILSIVILVVVLAAFIVGPALGGGNPANTERPVFGKFKGRPIEYVAGSFFVNTYQNQLQQAQQTAESANRQLGLQDAYNAFNSAFNATVVRYGILDWAEEYGVHVSSDEVAVEIASSPQFQDETGRYSNELYTQALSQDPILRQRIRENIIFNKVQEDVFSASGLSESEVDFIADMGQPRRVFDLISYDFSNYPISELSDYISENSQLFQTMEISTITLDNQREAQQLLERIRNREAGFGELAEANSSDIYASEQGVRGVVWYHEMQSDYEAPEAVDVLFGLAEGEVSDVFEIRGDQYVIYRADRAASDPNPLDGETIEKARSYILSFDRGRVSDYFIDQANEFIQRSNEIGWASALVESGLEATTTGAFGINYGNIPVFPTVQSASQGVLEGAGSRRTLFVDLFSLEQGELSSAIELRDKIIVARFVEPGEDTSDQNDFLKAYIPFLAQGYLQAEMQRRFSDPELLEDNFDQAVTRILFGGN